MTAEADARELLTLRADVATLRSTLRAIQEEVLWAYADGKLPVEHVPGKVQHEIDRLRKAPQVPGGILYGGGGR